MIKFLCNKILLIIFFVFLFGNFNLSIAQCSPDEPNCNNSEGVSNAAIELDSRIDAKIERERLEKAARSACNGTNNYTCYTLLEPLSTGTDITATVKIESGGLSAYINTVFIYLLMLIVVVSVFYLIYGGTLYLTTDIISKKFEGKEVIKRVVVGLIFVFSVWTIMNTINPNLLANTLNFNTIREIFTPPSADEEDAEVPPPQAARGICLPADVVTVNNIKVCKDIKENLILMLEEAKKSGITLTQAGPRGGWRSNEDQIALRAKNCGGLQNVNVRGAKCKPLTALPGESNHQGGRAIDFAEAGLSRDGKKSEAYKWLSSNAARFGFKNSIASEPWHWSVTGR
jgi:D-alanyl-D-alanine carboxypeptidase/Type IV secretion system pilin